MEGMDEIIKELYANTLTRDIADRLGCSIYKVRRRAYLLGLKKSREFVAGISRYHALNTNANFRKTSFKKGERPFNRGMRQAEYMSERGIENSSKTRFGKGSEPHNTRPAGFERINGKDGYVYIKLPGKRKMELKHRHVWESHYGLIPEGCNIQFRDGDRRNCDIANLYLISRKEQIGNNTVQRYPANIRTAMQAIGRIDKLINKNKKHETDQY